ncbi:MAG TPA: Hsp20/alpha crystallin family protein [Desulfuromonadales bacterium]|nr:Hsp20/alpha crystallin family protein [Desulfuromonadales bacterium]
MSEKNLAFHKDSVANSEKKIDNWQVPPVDIFETEEQLTLVADLPGVPRDQLSLGIDQGILTIEGLAAGVGTSNGIDREFGALGYTRRFQLPDTLDFEKIAAELKDGVLTVTLPKVAAARPRRIPITVH